MTAERLHDCASVHGYVGRICFKNGPPTKVGAEIELLVRGDDPHIHVPLAQVQAALRPALPLPGGSSLTYEPGGQVELSSPALGSLTSLVDAVQRDIDHVVLALGSSGLAPVDLATDPLRPPRRFLRNARYDAMEAYFDSREAGLPSDARVGRAMMASTAAVQVNLDAGLDPAFRWRLLHDLGPVLVAAFANSPTRAGTHTGWVSSRQQIWQQLDPTRTREPEGTDPVAAYAEFALDALVMVRRRDDEWEPAPGLTFREWVESDRPPTEDDLAYHLSTLFPPVRPRGWFEVRYLDAPPLQWWLVPVAVLTALLDDPATAPLAALAAEPARGRWRSAATVGLGDPVLAAAADAVFALAVESLERTEPTLAGQVSAYTDAYVSRRRCPADDYHLSPVLEA
jgi:glutamate--cysteine ligase